MKIILYQYACISIFINSVRVLKHFYPTALSSSSSNENVRFFSVGDWNGYSIKCNYSNYFL